MITVFLNVLFALQIQTGVEFQLSLVFREKCTSQKVEKASLKKLIVTCSSVTGHYESELQ